MQSFRLSVRAVWIVLVLIHPPLFAQSIRDSEAPVILVEVLSPGVNAATVADTIAEPVEKQLEGLEGLVHLVSRSGGHEDGSG